MWFFSSPPSGRWLIFFPWMPILLWATPHPLNWGHVTPVCLYSASFLFIVCYRFISCIRAFVLGVLSLTEKSSCSIHFSSLCLVFHLSSILSEVLCWVLSFVYTSFKWTILFSPTQYGLLNELDWVSLKWKTTLFFFAITVTLYCIKLLFYVPGNALHMFHSFWCHLQ